MFWCLFIHMRALTAAGGMVCGNRAVTEPAVGTARKPRKGEPFVFWRFAVVPNTCASAAARALPPKGWWGSCSIVALFYTNSRQRALRFRGTLDTLAKCDGYSKFLAQYPIESYSVIVKRKPRRITRAVP